MHEDSRVFAVRQAYGAFGVEDVFALCPAETPLVFAQVRIVLRIDYGEMALGQGDFAEGVAVAQAPPCQHKCKKWPNEPRRKLKCNGELNKPLPRRISELVN